MIILRKKLIITVIPEIFVYKNFDASNFCRFYN